MAEREVIIGLECHVQLDTESKLFCSCPAIAEQPNSACCEICLGMPGSKPVLNKKALEYALKVALALNCEINSEFFFSRKTYFYPDMAKNFQITQYEIPIGKNGFLTLPTGKKIKIRRVHLEEDPAALVHESGMMLSQRTLVDYNRSGVPLVEIVTDPDFSSPQQTREFLDQLTMILQYLKVFDIQQGTLKVDSNISLKGGARVEVKNITGKKGVEKALSFEAARQKGIVAKGETVQRETRAFNEATQTTRSLRGKETEEDYGYIFEADLTAIELSETYINSTKESLPELHDAKAKRFVEQYKLDEYTASVLARNAVLADLFDDVAKGTDPGIVAKFLTRELLAVVNRSGLDLSTLDLNRAELNNLFESFLKGNLTEKVVREAIIAYLTEGIKPMEFIEKYGLAKDLSQADIEKLVDEVLARNKKAVADLKAGEQKSMHFLVGQVMRLTKAKADPKTIQKIIKKKMMGG